MGSFQNRMHENNGGISPEGTRGPVMRPACFTLDMASDFTCPLDVGDPPTWTDASYKLPNRFKHGPWFDELNAISLINSGKDVVLGPGISQIEWSIVVTNSNAGAINCRAAMVNEGGQVYNQTPAIVIPGLSDIVIHMPFLTHNSYEDTSDEYALSVVQNSGAGGDLTVRKEYVGWSRKNGNSRESVKVGR